MTVNWIFKGTPGMLRAATTGGFHKLSLRLLISVVVSGIFSGGVIRAEDDSTSRNNDEDSGDVSDLIQDMDQNIVGPESAEEQASAATEDGSVKWVRAHALHVRAEPRYRSAIAGYLRHGAKVRVLTDGPWSRIGPNRWVKTSWLSETPPGD